MRRLLVVCVLGLAVTALAQDSGEGPHPVVEKLRGQYERQLEQARKQYVRDLEQAWERARQYDNYSAEQAIRDELDRVEEGGPSSDNQGRQLRQAMIGTVWTFHKGSIRFKEGGEVVRTSLPNEPGRWEPIRPQELRVRFPSGSTPDWTVVIAADAQHMMTIRRDTRGVTQHTEVHGRIE